jgi:hypothetical protein
MRALAFAGAAAPFVAQNTAKRDTSRMYASFVLGEAPFSTER